MIKLALVGTGGMAHAHANAFQKIRGVKLVAACDVDETRVKEFAAKFGIPKTYTSLDALLAESGVDAVANVTPDAHHAPVSLKVIAAGKHILCEKPLATNYDDARKMAAAAKRKGVIHMVNFSYRNSSALQKAAELVQKGALGEIRHVEAHYLQSWLSSSVWGEWSTTPAWLWRLSTAHGSKGVLGDIGVHILDMASFPVGPMSSLRCKLKTFPKAKGNRIGDYTLDANDSALIHVEFANGALGSITTTRYGTGHQNSLQLSVHGTEGALRIDLDKSYTQLETCIGKDRHSAAWKTLECKATPNMYERFVKSIRSGVNDQPDFHRGAEIQKALDACVLSDDEDISVSLT
jgi:predicted dehydrogenase